MSTPLICEKCGEEIVPGSSVGFIGRDPSDPDNRIMIYNDTIIVHFECSEKQESS